DGPTSPDPKSRLLAGLLALLATATLVGMLQVLPRFAATQHVDGARRNVEPTSPLGAGRTPAVGLLVPVVQDFLGLCRSELGVGRVLAAQPNVRSVPAIDRLQGALNTATGVPQAVVANLVDRVLWV